MEHLNSSGQMNSHYRSSSTKSYRFSGFHAAGGMSSTSPLGTSINEQPATEAGVSNGVTAHHTMESPVGGDGSGTIPTNASTWGSNPNGEDGEVALPPIGTMQLPLRDPSPLSYHRNIDSVRRGSGFRQSPSSSVLQSPTIQGAATFGGPGPSSLSGTSSTAPSGASGLQYPKSAMARSIVVCGPAGIGKSSLILANQTNWRSSGLWGYAKMVKGESSPFTGLVRRCGPPLTTECVWLIEILLFFLSAVLPIVGSLPADGVPRRPAHICSTTPVATRPADDQHPALVPRNARAKRYSCALPNQL